MKTTQQKQILKEVILKNKNGFTSDFNGNLISKEKGYFVGITNIKGKRINHLINKILYIKQNGFKENKNILVGGWKDEKENNFYLDLSLYTEDLNTALNLSKIFNQKAIFDLSKFESIYLK